MTKAELVAVIEHSARRLLQVSSPPVRYWLLTQVMGRDEEDRLLLQTIEECRDYPPKLKLLAKLREDGTWPIPKQRKLAEDQWLGPPYVLHLCSDAAEPVRAPSIQDLEG